MRKNQTKLVLDKYRVSSANITFLSHLPKMYKVPTFLGRQADFFEDRKR